MDVINDIQILISIIICNLFLLYTQENSYIAKQTTSSTRKMGTLYIANSQSMY